MSEITVYQYIDLNLTELTKAIGATKITLYIMAQKNKHMAPHKFEFWFRPCV